MNSPPPPPNHFFTPSFTFLSPTSNSNPNPNFSFSSPQPITGPNLPSTLSNLSSLITLAETTLKSISNDLHLHSSTQPSLLSPCPFNPHHRMPPESLFHHSLLCPSSHSPPIHLSILDSLHYPNSFKSEEQLRKENPFVQSIRDSDDADLCFSIEGFGEFGSNFFYKDCPGVVCLPELDTSKTTFTLPTVLSLQCANFVSPSSTNGSESLHLSRKCSGILPSELWGLRREVESWNDYPRSYSFTVFRAVLLIPMMKESDSMKWVIANSPCFGVVIDAPMRDHIFLLLRLCLRAILVEACQYSELNPMPMTFNCPVLVEVMSWLASQLSVLYGETNGKLFSIEMLKHCILNAASSLLIFPLEERKTGSMEEVIENGKTEEKKTELCGGDNLSTGKNATGGLIFVSQVAAAVAALHERYLLEEKIKGLRLVGSLSKSQLINEHSYVTVKADEERRKRSNYRPIVEHDGLLWQRSRNQDSSKVKTKEELLAEERDYKRRRMSYRGKKVKRKITEVMHDIIEEHMEEIKQAGGIGCFMKGSAETGVSPPGSVYAHDMTAEDGLKTNDSVPSGHGKLSHSYASKRSEESSLKDNVPMNYDLNNSRQQQKQESCDYHELPEEEQRSSKREKQDQEYQRKSAESYRSHGQSSERHRHPSKHNGIEGNDTKYEKNCPAYSHRSRDRESRYNSSKSSSSIYSSHRKYNQRSESKDYYRGRTHGTQRSEPPQRENTFVDRYDPSASDAYDDESSGSKYSRYNSYDEDGFKDDREVQRTDNTVKRHHYSHDKS